MTDDAKQEHDSVAKSVVNLYRFDTENDRLRALEAIAVYKTRQPQTDALKKAERALGAFMERYQSGFRADTEYVADLIRKALEALEQSKWHT